MISSVGVAAVVLGISSLISPEVSYFPGSYFDTHAKSTLQRRAMERWPGPSQLVQRWRSEELDRREKMAVLLGASAFRDPVMLPLYREAISSPNDRLRMAAAYGYRDLLGDALPNVMGGVDEAAGRALAGEMDAVAATLRTRPLVEFWLQAALATDGRSMPGWRGVVLKRRPEVCFRAVEKVLIFDDFSYLVTAYRLSESRSNRTSLMRLLEAVSLKRFYVKPKGARAGWGTRNSNEALEATDNFVDYWTDVRCVSDVRSVLVVSLAELGVRGVQPLEPDSYHVWLQLLRQGTPTWRMMAARRLYELGGRWSSLSIFRAEFSGEVEAWEDLLVWYGERSPGGRNQPPPNPVE